MLKLLLVTCLNFLLPMSLPARTRIHYVPFHGTQSEWNQLQQKREKDSSTAMIVAIGIVAVSLLIIKVAKD